jgi:hypothetical protein
MFPQQNYLRGALLMKTIFKHKRTHKDQVKLSEQKDADQRHEKIKDSALMDYYMMGGY